MPGMQDPRFARAVVYLCAHSAEGAMGLIVNKRAEDLVWKDLFKRLGIPIGSVNAPKPVHYGGPVETGRGAWRLPIGMPSRLKRSRQTRSSARLLTIRPIAPSAECAQR